ncbi:CHASE domain-containing protein [Phenylobacterium terrae]|uniref:histidine kinase n=1 Tax=Phenylobacterium terrae TaxID=2665495 RepID=A0ABW4N715_9CAUL
MRGLLGRIGASAMGRRLGLPRSLPVFVLIIGMVASTAASLQVRWLVEAKDMERFQHAADQTSGDIAARMQAYVAILKAGEGLFHAFKGEVDAAQFTAFADHLELPAVYPGIQGIGFSRKVAAADKAALIAEIRRQGDPDFTIRPDTPREEVHAIVYLEPRDARNEAAIGFDMFTHPVRRAAMAAARDAGEPVMSGKVELVQEITEDKQAGFLIYQPVYRGGATPTAVEERRRLLDGFVYAPFRADDLLHGIYSDQQNPRVDFAVYDGAPEPENLLHRSFSGSVAARAADARFTSERRITIAGRTWTLRFFTRPEFELGSGRSFPLLFLGGGMLATLLVAAATWSQVRARLAAEHEVAARQAAEGQLRLLLDELNHRVKNTLATVQSVAAQTLREGQAPHEAREEFEGRLVALSQTHDLLTRDSWRGARLADLVQVEVAPYESARTGRVAAKGPAVWLSPNLAVALGMALHELVTNAVKYGALSTDAGRVEIEWRLSGQGAERRLELCWEEIGGPPVAPPTRKGFGARLITTGLRRQLNGQVDLIFDPAGVRCTIDMPLPED